MRNLIYTLLLFVIVIAGCKKGKTPKPDKPFVTDIHAVGFKVINGSTYGIYWKNGVQVDITQDVNSAIYAIAVVGSDVYLAGRTSHGATYWRNGTPVYLTNNNTTTAYAIAISGNNVYVGGAGYKPGDNYTRATYWKNGAENDLTDGTTQAYVSSIAVSGNDVYTAGQNNLPDHGNVAGTSVAACWKNDAIILLSGALTQSYGSFAKGITVSGDDVYVAGYIMFSAALWKNGVLQNLDNDSDFPLGSFAFTVAVNNTNVYIGGGYGNEAAYWKNGVKTDLINGEFVSSTVGGINFEGDDVYMCGELINAPVYWKNNISYTLQNNGEAYSVNGIAVGRHREE